MDVSNTLSSINFSEFNDRQFRSDFSCSLNGRSKLQAKLKPFLKEVFMVHGANEEASDFLVDLIPIKQIKIRTQKLKKGEVRIDCPLCEHFGVNVMKTLQKKFPKEKGNIKWSQDYMFWWHKKLSKDKKTKLEYFFCRMREHMKNVHSLDSDDVNMPYAIRSCIYYKERLGKSGKPDKTMEDYKK